jgi:hypothetical protein
LQRFWFLSVWNTLELDYCWPSFVSEVWAMNYPVYGGVVGEPWRLKKRERDEVRVAECVAGLRVSVEYYEKEINVG